MGKSRGGLSTKIHAAVDALGNPVRLLLTAGQASEYGQSKALIEGWVADYVLADKGYDSDEFIEAIEWSGAIAVIPPRCHRKAQREYDREVFSAFRPDRIAQQTCNEVVGQLNRCLPATRHNVAAPHTEYKKNRRHHDRNGHEQRRIGERDVHAADFHRDDRLDDELFERTLPAVCRHCRSLLAPLNFRFLFATLGAVSGRISVSAHRAENIQKPCRAS